MRLKNYLFGFMAMLALLSGMHQPLLAAKKERHSSSSSHKKDLCCKKINAILTQIDQTATQDLIVDQTTLNIVNQINQTTTTDLAVDQETLDIVKHLQDCSCTCTVIMPEDFADDEGNLSQTYYITEPGNYCLGADVAFSPSDIDVPAIQILASDVNLNLRGFTLSQSAENRIPLTYGVIIGQGYFYDDPNAVLINNVTVENGTVSQFTGCGVLAYNAGFDDPSFEVIPFTNLRFAGLNILDCGNEGFDVDSAPGLQLSSFAPFIAQTPDSPVAFTNVVIENCNVNRTIGGLLGGTGIFIDNFDNVVIRNCQANDMVTTNAFGSGNTTAGYYFLGRNLQMTNCQGNGTMDLDPRNTRAQVGGIFLQLSLNAYIKDCQFNDAYGESSNIVNSNLSLNNNFVAENCQFNNARGGEFAAIVAGVHCSSSLTSFVQGNGIKWINCQFNGSSVSPANPANLFVAGFLATTMRGMTFENCQACNHQGVDSTYITSGYYIIAFDGDSPGVQFSDADNITFQNCIASDIDGTYNAYGFFVGGGNLNIFAPQVVHNNMVLNSCIAERIHSTSDEAQVAGIAESLGDFTFFDPNSVGSYPLQIDLFISDCRISDVRSSADEPSPLSAGILVGSVINPDIRNNSISDCDRGILLTGTNSVTPNCFQLAATEGDALAVPPVFIPLDVELQVTVNPDPNGINPIPAFYTSNGPRLTSPITAPAALTNPASACSTVTNNLTGKIGIVQRTGACNSASFVLKAEAAGDVATLILSGAVAPNTFGGSPLQTKVAVAIRQSDGAALLTSLNNNPGSTVTIDLSPSTANTYTFANITQGNSVNATSLQIDSSGRSFICPSDDLTALGWQPGDLISFICSDDEPIPELECDTNYYGIVYIPGFSRNGLIQNNKIDNCSISCYQDDADTTLSGWVNNTAFNCGSPPSVPPQSTTNYDINFAGVRPVDVGSLSAYPVGGNKYYNLSLVP
ncbi:MAG: hypothetical protein JSR37_10215 [Verrucomicrobia bacterium]|nr:hypothetical protein [Verrucomicrobiota bacterium]MBS0637449.1 hypothetical protein [Verrucomicrobiota bacterium]